MWWDLLMILRTQNFIQEELAGKFGKQEKNWKFCVGFCCLSKSRLSRLLFSISSKAKDRAATCSLSKEKDDKKLHRKYKKSRREMYTNQKRKGQKCKTPSPKAKDCQVLLKHFSCYATRL